MECPNAPMKPSKSLRGSDDSRGCWKEAEMGKLTHINTLHYPKAINFCKRKFLQHDFLRTVSLKYSIIGHSNIS